MEWIRHLLTHMRCTDLICTNPKLNNHIFSFYYIKDFLFGNCVLTSPFNSNYDFDLVFLKKKNESSVLLNSIKVLLTVLKIHVKTWSKIYAKLVLDLKF